MENLMMTLNTTIQNATQTLVDHLEELTALDQAIGDGDHGLNMKRGAQAIQAKLPEMNGLGLLTPKQSFLSSAPADCRGGKY